MKLPASLVLCFSFALAGCLSKVDLTRISPGMSKDEVVSRVGKPKNVAVQGRTEIFTYESESSYFDGKVGGDFLYVRFIDGKVESFGQKGDFDSTKNPTIDINTRVTTQSTVTQNSDGKMDLEAELRRLDRLRKDGLITDAEFESQKKKLLAR